MRVLLDTSDLEDALTHQLERAPDAIFAHVLCGRTVTNGDLLQELRDEAPYARDVVQAMAVTSLKLWAMRRGR